MIKKIEDIENYGDMVAYFTKGFLISYKEYGSYQGDWMAIIEKDREIIIHKGSYGSCGGCDFLQDRSDDLTDKEIKDYMGEDDTEYLRFSLDNVPETVEDLIALFPANTRIDYKEEWEDEDGVSKPWLNWVLEQMKRDRSTNLEYLEWRAAEKGVV